MIAPDRFAVFGFRSLSRSRYRSFFGRVRVDTWALEILIGFHVFFVLIL